MNGLGSIFLIPGRRKEISVGFLSDLAIAATTALYFWSASAGLSPVVGPILASMKEARRVLLLGDDELILGGLARLLDHAEGWRVTSSLEAEPDAVLVDFGSGEESENVRSLAPRYPVLAIASEPARAREALASGARGVVSRKTSGPRLSRALDAILEGLVVIDEDLAEDALRPPPRPLGSHETLTPRELEVLEHLASGLSNKEIASRLGVSFHTVKFHVNAILGKLGASSRTEVVALAAQAGLLRF